MPTICFITAIESPYLCYLDLGSGAYIHFGRIINQPRGNVQQIEIRQRVIAYHLKDAAKLDSPTNWIIMIRVASCKIRRKDTAYVHKGGEGT